LNQTASILADDLKEMLGWEYTITTGKAKKNDIYLSLSQPDEQLGKEGYELAIHHQVSIKAPTPQGVFWGTRTLLQMLYKQKAT
jgi:hexosaminidase